MHEVTVRLTDQQYGRLEEERARAGMASLGEFVAERLCRYGEPGGGTDDVASPAVALHEDEIASLVQAGEGLSPLEVDEDTQALIDAAEQDLAPEEWTPELKARLLAEGMRRASLLVSGDHV